MRILPIAIASQGNDKWRMKRRNVWWMRVGVVILGLVLASGVVASNCAATGHPVVPSALGTPSGSGAMEALLEQPGPMEIETVVSTSWVGDRANLVNLDHPRARAAGLTDGEEPIEVYFHVLRHPTRGTFLVDTGVERALRDAPDGSAVSGLVQSVMHMDRMAMERPLGDWLADTEQHVDGVFLTHLHLDHVAGLPDLPRDTPVYAGPGEARHGSLLNVLTRGTMDRQLAGMPPLSEWRFEVDPQGAFDGVLDVFGDGSVFALYGPGHTGGSTAYLVRCTSGPVLLAGDTASTAWGWENDVDPGAFTADHAGNAVSLARLRDLVVRHPTIDVRLGHQRLGRPSRPSRLSAPADGHDEIHQGQPGPAPGGADLRIPDVR